MFPLVSILVPAYNAHSWLADSLRSALEQSWPRKEVIVVDDGSSDDTLALARSFESPMVKVVTQENRGASAARNHALSLAQGDYIQWLDADNVLHPEKISLQLSQASDRENSRVLLSSSWGFFYYRTDKAEFRESALWADLTPVEWLYRKLKGNIFMVPESWLVTRELTEKAGRWNEKLSLDDDGDYFSRVIAHCDRIEFLPQPKSYYRCGNPGSLSSVVRRPDKKLQSQFASMRGQITLLLSMEDSPRTRAACVQYLQDGFFYFYPDNMDLVEKSRALAAELGGELTLPTLPWKYAWIKSVFGWKVAKEVCFFIPSIRTSLTMRLDGMLHRMEGKRPAVEPAAFR